MLIRLLLMSTVLVAACQGTVPARDAGQRQVRTEYDPATGRLETLALERDDGSTEARAYMQGTRVDRIELDTNGDGQADRWEFYDVGTRRDRAVGALPANPIVRAEQSTRFDGSVSRWEHYEGGVIARIEEDVSGDGRVDKWERYVEGTLASVDLDLSGRGTPDRRLVFRPDGSTEMSELP